MLQVDVPDTFVLATGRTETVREFTRLAFKSINIEMEFIGSGEDEVGKDKVSGQTLVTIDNAFYRPAEVELLVGDPAKAMRTLDWSPRTTLEELCKMMVDADRARVEKGVSF